MVVVGAPSAAPAGAAPIDRPMTTVSGSSASVSLTIVSGSFRLLTPGPKVSDPLVAGP